MKLCNDCDLNYRTSKNKRLLVELTLIQCAQLTLPDADDLIGGRSPKRRLKPLFKQQAATNTATQNQSQTGVVAAQTQATANGGYMGNRKSPLPEIKEEKRIPIIKAGTIGMSMRRQPVSNVATNKPTNSSPSTTSSVQTDYEDYVVYEKDLIYYWRDFASKLPKEESANAARMMNISPKLLNDTNFEIGVDNEMVAKYMTQLMPSIQKHLRESLHNRKITMTIRTLEVNEIVRAYSQVERFKLMNEKNPKLQKLKEILGLELS